MNIFLSAEKQKIKKSSKSSTLAGIKIMKRVKKQNSVWYFVEICKNRVDCFKVADKSRQPKIEKCQTDL